MALSIQQRVRKVLSDNANLQADIGKVSDDADLYAAGLTSHATVNLMLALEQEFDIEFPERLLRRATFASVSSIAAALVEIGAKD